MDFLKDVWYGITHYFFITFDEFFETTELMADIKDAKSKYAVYRRAYAEHLSDSLWKQKKWKEFLKVIAVAILLFFVVTRVLVATISQTKGMIGGFLFFITVLGVVALWIVLRHTSVNIVKMYKTIHTMSYDDAKIDYLRVCPDAMPEEEVELLTNEEIVAFSEKVQNGEASQDEIVEIMKRIAATREARKKAADSGDPEDSADSADSGDEPDSTQQRQEPQPAPTTPQSAPTAPAPQPAQPAQSAPAPQPAQPAPQPASNPAPTAANPAPASAPKDKYAPRPIRRRR